jgi:hypothetical protein
MIIAAVHEKGDEALRNPSSADNWVMLAITMHEVASHCHEVNCDFLDVMLDHEMWCYSRALSIDPKNEAAVYNRANLIAQGIFWRWRKEVWPAMITMGAQSKLYAGWLEVCTYAPTPEMQLLRARVHATAFDSPGSTIPNPKVNRNP